MFKEKLIRMRKRKKLTQKELGKLIYVSRSTICKWEMGLGVPSDVNLKSLCDLFEVSDEWLMNDNKNLKLDSEYLKNNYKFRLKKVITLLLIAVSLITIYPSAFLIKYSIVTSQTYQQDYLDTLFDNGYSSLTSDCLYNDTSSSLFFVRSVIYEDKCITTLTYNYNDFTYVFENGKAYLYNALLQENKNLISEHSISLGEYTKNIFKINFNIEKISHNSNNFNLFKTDIHINIKTSEAIISFPIINETINICDCSLYYYYNKDLTNENVILITGSYQNQVVSIMYAIKK